MSLINCLQFYFTSGRPPLNAMTEDFLSKVNQFFLSRLDGVQIKGAFMFFSC